jgi:hypothetical protein
MMVDIPYRLAGRPRDARGLVIPFVQFIKADGTPDFRVLDDALMARAVRHRLCGLCGDKIRGDVYFIGGPLCVENGFFYDPPMHKDCARYAICTCPHLARSKGRYAPQPEPGTTGPGIALIAGAMDISKKAEWFGLMRATGYQSSHTETMMLVIKAKLPWVSVERWRDGGLMETT